MYGPFFMETTITGIVYLAMLQQFIPQSDKYDQEGRIHFQQDGARPHYLEVREYLNTRFPDLWIGRAARPPRSPELTPLHFFLWGFVEDRAFVPPLPANVAELRTRITAAAVAEVTPEMLRSVWQDIGYWWDGCRITNGSHIEP
jgi:hypothetical protein